MEYCILSWFPLFYKCPLLTVPFRCGLCDLVYSETYLEKHDRGDWCFVRWQVYDPEVPRQSDPIVVCHYLSPNGVDVPRIIIDKFCWKRHVLQGILSPLGLDLRFSIRFSSLILSKSWIYHLALFPSIWLPSVASLSIQSLLCRCLISSVLSLLYLTCSLQLSHCTSSASSFCYSSRCPHFKCLSSVFRRVYVSASSNAIYHTTHLISLSLNSLYRSTEETPS